MVVAWWNGGGRLKARINVNPELRKYISKGPDIFVYGEPLVTRTTNGLYIPGYNIIIHKAQLDGVRRGLIVYYKEKHATL